MNALTIDVEDWYHVCGGPELPALAPADRRVLPNVERLLALLAEYGVKATFFILGSVAAEQPTLAPLIAAAGHEIASHGWSHRLVTGLTPAEFREEVRKTGELLERQTGRRPTGFRAPQWSLSRETTPWAFAILREEGYHYDSSLNPLPLIGDRRGARVPFPVTTDHGTIAELPPLVTPAGLINLPTGGGWGLRFFPEALLTATIRRLNRRGTPAVLYLHPRELDPAGPRLKLGPLRSFAAYGPRSGAETRLRSLLQRFCFTSLRELVEQCDFA